MSETGSISRRDFLKLSAAATGALLLSRSSPDFGEVLREKELSVGALRVNMIEGENKLEHGLRVLAQMEKALREEPLDFLITPEYSFELTHGPEKNYERRPLAIQKNSTGFSVDTLKSSSAARIIVENSQSLAKSHKTCLFLSSFSDSVGHTIAIFINKNGCITGVKEKFFPPDGKFEITRGSKTLKVLPMICGEVWEKSELNPFRAIPPNWVREGAPYDIFAHTISQRDLDFNKLAALVQKTKIPEDSQLTNNEKWQRDCFKGYYGEYLQFLQPNAPILISDIGMAGCFKQDLSPFNNYHDRGEYVVAKLDVSQFSPTDK